LGNRTVAKSRNLDEKPFITQIKRESVIVMKKNSTCQLVVFLCLMLIAPIFFPAVWATENSWTTMASMPTARSSLGAAVIDGKIYAIGGKDGVNEVYDPATNTWATKAPLPSQRTSFGIATYANKIYVIGGYANTTTDGISNLSGLVEVYDPATNSWETKTSMPTPRAQLTACTVNGKIYTLGGFENSFSGKCSAVNQVYDPETDTWSTKKPMLADMYAHCAVALGDKIYVIWGQSGGQSGSYLSGPWNQIYDTRTNTWTLGAAPPEPVHRSAAVATSGLYAPQKIYVIGGEVGFMEATNTTQIYDPQTDTWSMGASMPTARQRLALAVVDDLIYAIGGSYPEYWNPASNSQNRHYTLLSASNVESLNFVPQQNSALNERYTPIGYAGHEPSEATSPPNDGTKSQPDLPVVAIAAASVAVVAVAGVTVLLFLRKYTRRQQTS
jgi:N-acetylneuraminic acid mutarotase